MEELQMMIRKTGMSPMDFCKEAGISYGTFRNRVKRPGTFRVDEIIKLRTALRMKKADFERIFFGL